LIHYICDDLQPRKAEIAQKYEFSGQQTEIERAEPMDKRRGGRMPFVEKNTAKPAQGNNQRPSSPAQKVPHKPPQQNKSPQGQGQGQGQGQQKPSGDQQQKKPAPNADPSAREKAKNERQKSSKANHNRRNQHAKKMASMNP